MLEEPEDCSRLILLKHPRLADPSRDLALGRGDADLSRRGRAQVLVLAETFESLGIDRVLSAPARHCVETAEALGKRLGLEVEREDRLADQDLGDWEGRSWPEIRVLDEGRLLEFFADYGTSAPPGGESLCDAVDRWIDWWEEERESARKRRLLLVGSGRVLQGFAARLLGLSIRRAPALTLPDGAFGILDAYRDGAVLRSWHPFAARDDLP